MFFYHVLGGGTHALHGTTSPPPPAPPPPSASPHLNLRGLVFNFIKKIALAALSFFLLRIFFSRTKSFIDIDFVPVAAYFHRQEAKKFATFFSWFVF